MANDFFTLPFNSKKIISNVAHDKCDLRHSIAHHIHLITTSYFGECTFDDSFGCSIWDIDFDNLSSSNKMKSIIVESLINSLKRHEKRLHKLDIGATIKQEEISALKGSNVVKKKVTISIKGKIQKTNENFHYTEYFYIGPLSF